MIHTPGPWRYTKVGGQSRDLQIVSVVTGGFIAQASSEQHARLIAAAPDLLTELQHLVRLMQPKEATSLDVPGLATLNGARAAIAKATGLIAEGTGCAPNEAYLPARVQR